MLPSHLALISLTPTIDFGELATVCAAIQKQLTRDFGPIWTVEATIDVFARLEDVPVGYWKILVVDTFDHGGQHRDRNQQPFALVAAGTSWSLVASHEALEMLADPFGSRLIAGPSPMPEQSRVEFLVEVCDPCQADAFAYTINGIMVSDFYTPKYFDPVVASGVRYSFSGAVTEPRQVLNGGYLSWRDPTSGDWHQANRFSGALQFKNFGQIQPTGGSLRAMIDGLTPETLRLSNLDRECPSMRRAATARASATTAAAAQAKAFEAWLRRANE